MHSSQFSRVLCNVAYVDLHSYLSLEHGRSCRCPSLVVESEGQWRKHTMLKIRNLKPEKKSEWKQWPKSRKQLADQFFSLSPKGNSVLYFRSLPLNYIQNLWFFPRHINPQGAKIFCALKPITLQMLDLTYAFVIQRGSNVSLKKCTSMYLTERKAWIKSALMDARGFSLTIMV